MRLLSKFIFVLTAFIFGFVTFAADSIDPFTKEFFSSHFKLKAEDVRTIKLFAFQYQVIFQDGKRDSAQEFFTTLKQASIPARFCDGTGYVKEISVDIAEFQKDKLIKISELTPRHIETTTPLELVKIVVNAAKIKRLEELLAINTGSETFLSTAREIKSLDLTGEKDISISDVLLMLERIFSETNDLNLSRMELGNEGLEMLFERLPLTAVKTLTITKNCYNASGEAMIEQYFTSHQDIKVIYDGFIARSVEEFKYTPDCFESHYGNFRDISSEEEYYDWLSRVEQTLRLIKQSRAYCEKQGTKTRTEYIRVEKVKQASFTKHSLATVDVLKYFKKAGQTRDIQEFTKNIIKAFLSTRDEALLETTGPLEITPLFHRGIKQFVDFKKYQELFKDIIDWGIYCDLYPGITSEEMDRFVYFTSLMPKGADPEYQELASGLKKAFAPDYKNPYKN